MRVDEVMSTARNAITVERVFSEPYERNGITVIPAAVVGGAAGGGAGHDGKGQDGEGGGFGMTGRSAGVYVIQDSRVSWRPAVDPNRMVTIAGMVLIAYLVTRPRLARARAVQV